MKQVDSNMSGIIDFSEFSVAAMNLEKMLTKNKME